MTSTVHRYDLRLRWDGNRGTGTLSYTAYGRDHTIEVPGKVALHGSADPAFHGDLARHNPEDLFLAAVAACHMLSYLALCARSGVNVEAYEDAACAELALDDRGGGAFHEVTLRPRVRVASPASITLATRLHQLAHERCFIAASVGVPIKCEPEVTATNRPTPVEARAGSHH